MENDKILTLLKKVANVLQGEYKSVDKCKAEICSVLEDVDKMAIEISGKSIVKRGRVTETLAKGMYGH